MWPRSSMPSSADELRVARPGSLIEAPASGVARPRILCMGVAGCGKSSLGIAVARAEDLPFFEGDAFHSPLSRQKMAAGVPLTDDDRMQWLGQVAEQLAAHGPGVVGTCSALKRSYRDLLRRAAPGLRFVFMDLSRDLALQRVAGRAGHFFSPALVDDQFATLESPLGEAGVLRVDAREPIPVLAQRVQAWLRSEGPGGITQAPGP
jgi:gluconokinase